MLTQHILAEINAIVEEWEPAGNLSETIRNDQDSLEKNISLKLQPLITWRPDDSNAFTRANMDSKINAVRQELREFIMQVGVKFEEQNERVTMIAESQERLSQCLRTMEKMELERHTRERDDIATKRMDVVDETLTSIQAALQESEEQLGHRFTESEERHFESDNAMTKQMESADKRLSTLQSTVKEEILALQRSQGGFVHRLTENTKAYMDRENRIGESLTETENELATIKAHITTF
ncbi:hypothetical protein M501DRAFT_1020615 [Patellaria atrata CBS 101060]|uniref:Uncharacterized protein n=1 Tax=Patellaria atrata CBS 101060 TaxID=1346257 RepID=A0A9P4S3S4_9PEZI|nr:hypothetical protein M501DRAFT_1020615 [Patellaria atrata CBS 101060]